MLLLAPHRKYLAEPMLCVLQASVRVSLQSLAVVWNLQKKKSDKRNITAIKVLVGELILRAWFALLFSNRRVIKKNLLRLAAEERRIVWAKEWNAPLTSPTVEWWLENREHFIDRWPIITLCDPAFCHRSRSDPRRPSAWQLNNALYAQEPW